MHATLLPILVAFSCVPLHAEDAPVLVRIGDGQVTEELAGDRASLVQADLCPDRPFGLPLAPMSLDAFRHFFSSAGSRLILTPERLRLVNIQAAKDPRLRKQVDALVASAEALLAKEVPAWRPAGPRWEGATQEQTQQTEQQAAALISGRRTLALAFALTGDVQLAERAWEYLRAAMVHFYRWGAFRMPYPWESPWDEGLELYDALETFDLIAHWEGLRPADHALVLTYLRRLGTRVAYAVELSPTIGSEQAMWTANLGCLTRYAPDIPEAPRWSALVRERLHNVMSDLMADGGSIECDPDRQSFTLHYLLRYARLLQQDGDDKLLRGKWGDFGATLESACNWLACIATPLGNVVALNDSPPTPLAACGSFLEGIEAFGRGDWVRAGRVTAQDWSPLTCATPLPAAKDPEVRSEVLADSGLAVLRDGWRETDNYLLMDFGPPGGPHGHLDKLGFTMYAQGQPWVLDAGPAPDLVANAAEQESWHRQTAAHSTVLVDGQSQEPTDGRLAAWFTHPKFDVVAAEHDGYPDLTHRRTVFHPRGGYFLVFDELADFSERPRDLEWLLHVNGRRESGTVGHVTFWREGGFGLSVVPARQRGIRGITVGEGLCTGSDGESATVLTKQTPGPWVPGEPGWAFIPFLRMKLALPADETRTFCVALVPFKDKEPDTTVDVLDTDLAHIIEVRAGQTRDRILIRRSGAGEGMARGLGLATDGEYAFVREEEGKVPVLEWVEGSSLSVN